MKKLWLSILTTLVWLTGQSPALACSSCGSGAVDPLVLFKNENRKYYLGISSQGGFRNIDSRGKASVSLGAERQNNLVLSYAHRLFYGPGFLSFTAGYQNNIRDSRSKGGYTDPLIALRYSLIEQSFVSPWKPQGQLLLSHKKSITRSIHTSSIDLLDIFGSGFSESSVGFDLWFGMLPINFGSSLIYSYLHPDSKNGIRIDPGNRLTKIITVGKVFSNKVKVISGVIASDYAKSRDNDSLVENSERRDRDLFLTIESLSYQSANIRITFTQRGSWGEVKNGVKGSSVTIALMRGFL